MKALIRDRYGSPDVLELREVERPVPHETEVLVRVHAASQSWTAVIPLRQDLSYQLFEFACHEGNYWTMRLMLGGARLAEK